MKRIPQLDGIRGIAIIMVLLWHYIYCEVPRTGFGSRPCRWLSLTWSGVDLFFVLSGFLIGGILLDQRKSKNYFQVFYLRRCCRIFPLYFLILGLFVFGCQFAESHSPKFLWLFEHPMPLASYATFTQNFYMGARATFGPNWLAMTWSLAVEEQFYLILPLIIYFLPKRIVFSVLIILILMAPILRSLHHNMNSFVGAPWRADSLLSGVVLAILFRSTRFLDLFHQYRGLAVAVFIVMLFGAGITTSRPATFELFGSFGVFDHLWLAGLYTLLVLLAITGAFPGLNLLLTNPVLIWFGTISYGLYIFHQPVSGLLHGVILGKAPEMKSLVDVEVTILALLTSILLATLSYYCFERPILKWGHSFPYSKNTKAVG